MRLITILFVSAVLTGISLAQSPVPASQSVMTLNSSVNLFANFFRNCPIATEESGDQFYVLSSPDITIKIPVRMSTETADMLLTMRLNGNYLIPTRLSTGTRNPFCGSGNTRPDDESAWFPPVVTTTPISSASTAVVMPSTMPEGNVAAKVNAQQKHLYLKPAAAQVGGLDAISLVNESDDYANLDQLSRDSGATNTLRMKNNLNRKFKWALLAFLIF